MVSILTSALIRLDSLYLVNSGLIKWRLLHRDTEERRVGSEGGVEGYKPLICAQSVVFTLSLSLSP